MGTHQEYQQLSIKNCRIEYFFAVAFVCLFIIGYLGNLTESVIVTTKLAYGEMLTFSWAKLTFKD